jgi:hypothetical protein
MYRLKSIPSAVMTALFFGPIASRGKKEGKRGRVSFKKWANCIGSSGEGRLPKQVRSGSDLGHDRSQHRGWPDASDHELA